MKSVLNATLLAAFLVCFPHLSSAFAAERDAAPKTTAPLPVTPKAPATEAEPFKCSPHTQKCSCSGRADCNYMKETVGASCGKTSCTGKGSTRKCVCTLSGG